MPTTYLDDLRTRVRYQLKEATADKWQDTELNECIASAVAQLSEQEPYHLSVDTFFCGNSRLIDLAAISDYIKIERIEYKVYKSGVSGTKRTPKEFKNWKRIGNFIEIVVDSVPTEGTTVASGTATSTSAGNLVDSVAPFLSTMKYCRVVNTTDGTETYITSYTSTGQVAVADDIFVSGDAYIVYQRIPVTIFYDMTHTLTNSTKTYPPHYDNLIIDGAVAKAIMSYAIEAADKATIGDNVAPNMLALARTNLLLWQNRLDKLEDIYVEETYPTV